MPERVVPMATCPRDGAPLIMTMAFRGYEFICLECGAKMGFLDPRPAEPTPELDARYEALKAEWDEHVGGKLIVEGRAARSPADQEAHDAAIAWIAQRSGASA